MLPGGIYNETYGQEMAILRTPFRWALLIALLVLAIVLPMLASAYVLAFLCYVGVFVIAVMGLNILSGYAHQVSLGHAGFVVVGAYATAFLSTRLEWPFWVTVPCAGLIAALVALVFGTPSLRIKGFYLAMSTLAAHFIISWGVMRLPWLPVGTYSVPVAIPSLGGIPLTSDRHYYYLLLVYVVVMALFARNLMRTQIGRALLALRDNDIVAQAMGINVFRYKLIAFGLAGFYAGVSGALWGYWVGVVSLEQFSFWESVWYLAMVIVGGMGTTLGPFFGTLFIRLLMELSLNFGGWMLGAFPSVGGHIVGGLSFMANGLALVLFLIFQPRGLAHAWDIIKTRAMIWPFSYEARRGGGDAM